MTAQFCVDVVFLHTVVSERACLKEQQNERSNFQVNAIKMVKNWLEKFGPGYEKLNFVEDYLKGSKVQF